MTVDEDCQRLMSLVAHELRSPGAVVAGYLRLLAKNTAPALTEPERKMIDEANKSCGRLLHIAQELSELAELSGEDPVRTWLPVPIFTMCGEVVQSAADAGGAVSFSTHDRDKEACVEGHAGRLRQALGLMISVHRTRAWNGRHDGDGRHQPNSGTERRARVRRTSGCSRSECRGRQPQCGLRSVARRNWLIAAHRLPRHRSASRRRLGATQRLSWRLRGGTPSGRGRLGRRCGPEGPRSFHFRGRLSRLLQHPSRRLVRTRHTAQGDSTWRIATHELVTAETAKKPSKGSSNPRHPRLL